MILEHFGVFGVLLMYTKQPGFITCFYMCFSVNGVLGLCKSVISGEFCGFLLSFVISDKLWYGFIRSIYCGFGGFCGFWFVALLSFCGVL